MNAMASDLPRTDAPTARPRVRLSKDERRRQLVGIGLRALTERPIQEVSLDSVAAEAGISRGLLFHYFPTKTAFHEAVVGAAGRRIVRNVQPDDDALGLDALRQVLERYVAQIERRRALYLALVHGNLADLGGTDMVGTLRGRLCDVLLPHLLAAGVTPDRRVLHAWLAYVEDIVISWSEPAPELRDPASQAAVVEHCEKALAALHDLDTARFPDQSRPTTNPQ